MSLLFDEVYNGGTPITTPGQLETAVAAHAPFPVFINEGQPCPVTSVVVETVGIGRVITFNYKTGEGADLGRVRFHLGTISLLPVDQVLNRRWLSSLRLSRGAAGAATGVEGIIGAVVQAFCIGGDGTPAVAHVVADNEAESWTLAVLCPWYGRSGLAGVQYHATILRDFEDFGGQIIAIDISKLEDYQVSGQEGMFFAPAPTHYRASFADAAGRSFPSGFRAATDDAARAIANQIAGRSNAKWTDLMALRAVVVSLDDGAGHPINGHFKQAAGSGSDIQRKVRLTYEGSVQGDTVKVEIPSVDSAFVSRGTERSTEDPLDETTRPLLLTEAGSHVTSFRGAKFGRTIAKN